MATDLLGSMRVEIVGDNSQLDGAINQSERRTEELGSTVTSLGKTFKKVFTGVAILAVVKGLAKVTKELVSAASDAEETKNKFTVVFSSVADEAEEAADRIKDEFKLSDETVQKFLSGVGDITSGLGATSEQALDAADQITRLGLDINSFANLSGGAEQAVSALTSLFTGEREAAKALGIVINDTNLKAYAEEMGLIFKELTPLEKGFLSLELATSQSQLSIGDFARSADSYANTMKAAEEATKDLKAAIGASLIPVASASVGIFDKLTRKITEQITAHNQLRELLDKFENDIDTAQDRVDLTEREIAVTQKLYDENLRILTLRQGTALNEQDQLAIDALFEKSSLLNIELRSRQRLLETFKKEAAAEKEISDAVAEKEANIARLASVQLDLASTLEKRRKDALTDEDKAIDNLNKQIEKWAEYRDIIGVQELLNELIAERNELTETSLTVEQQAADERLSNILAEEQALIDRDDRLRELEEETQARREQAAIDLTEAILAENERAKISFEDLAKTGIGALTSGFQALGQSLVEEGLQFKDFGKIALTTLAEVLSALGAQLAAQAAINFFGLIPNIPGGIGSLAASATAFTASGVLKGLAGSFQGGGIVPGTPSRIDNTIANVASGELIANQDQKDRMLMQFLNGGGSGGPTTVIAQIDKKVLFKIILDGSKQGLATFDSRGVINQ